MLRPRESLLLSAFLVILTTLLCFINSALAAGGTIGAREIWPLSEELPPSPKPKSYTFEIAPEIYWFFYEEPSLSVEWEGIMYGIRMSLDQRFPQYPLVGRAEARYSVGRVDYDGFLSDGTPHTDSGTDWTLEGRILFGYEIGNKETSVFTPFLGIGYRYWLDDLESANAYQRSIEYLYSPLGIEGSFAVGEKWRWGLKGEYDLFWRGWVDSHLEDVNPSFNTIQNTQNNGGFGVRVSLYLKRLLRGKTAFVVEPYVRYWEIEESDTAPLTFSGVLIGSGVEPANKTIESGLQISFIF